MSVDAWKPFVADFAATCRRRTWYEAAGPSAKDECTDFDATQSRLNANLGVLQAYFGALAAISTDSNYSIDGGIKSLADGASAADSAHKDEIKAAQGLASTIAGWITAGVRHQSLARAVGHAGEAEKVVDAISAVIDGDYRAELSLEANQWNDDVKSGASAADAVAKLINAGAPPLGLPPKCEGKFVQWLTPDRFSATADQLMYQHFYMDRCNSILRREAALDDFGKSVKSMRTALQDLSTEPFRPKDKDVIDQLFKQAKDLADKIDAVKKAFGGASTTSVSTVGSAAAGAAS